MHIYFTNMRRVEELPVPSLFMLLGYKIYFWANEGTEPIHVHVAKGKPGPNGTKIWLTSSGGCIVANNNSQIQQRDLNKLIEVIESQFFFILRQWKEFFQTESVTYFC